VPVSPGLAIVTYFDTPRLVSYDREWAFDYGRVTKRPATQL
jgi:hypothetical protein